MAARRQLALLLPALLLGFILPAPAAAAPLPVELTGTLELLHGEDAVTGSPSYEYRLRTANERVMLKLRGEAPEGFVSGATVRVRGERNGGELVALDGATSSPQVLVAAPGFTGARRVAVVLINFTNNTAKPFSRGFTNGVMFTNANSVRAYFAEQSHNAMVLEGTTFDWIKVPFSNATCQPEAWEAAAKAILAGRGVDLRAYTNFQFVFPKTSACQWRGLGWLPGSTTWVNGAPALRTSSHELAHNFGVHHASSLRCTANGVRVALSRNCTASEYGDPFTTMGASQTRHETNLALAQMGYLPSGGARTITASGTYTLTHAAASSGTRILGVPRGDGTWFYLEYRRPYGTHFDNFSKSSAAVNGVSVRIAKSWASIIQTRLIDMVPSTTTFDDAPLRATRTFKDYLSGIKLTVTALGSSAATVSITLGPDAVAPSVPGAVRATATSESEIKLTWTASTDNRAVAGYRIWRGSSLVKTTTASAVSFTDTGLAGRTTFAYTIRAVDGAGNVSAPVTASATTPYVDVTAPSTPVATITAVNTHWADLTWTASTDDVGVESYLILRDGVTEATASGTTLVLRVPLQGSYTVVAVDAAGNAGAPSAAVSL